MLHIRGTGERTTAWKSEPPTKMSQAGVRFDLRVLHLVAGRGSNPWHTRTRRAVLLRSARLESNFLPSTLSEGQHRRSA